MSIFISFESLFSSCFANGSTDSLSFSCLIAFHIFNFLVAAYPMIFIPSPRLHMTV